MEETATDIWKGVVASAIQSSSSLPVIGTRFRAAINSAAEQRDLQFPPPEEPELRFIQLLLRHPDVVTVLRRPGQDFVVVPADKSELLSKGMQGKLYGIRQAFFEAFSKVSGRLDLSH